METPTQLFFYGEKHQQIGCFSNFYPSSFMDNLNTKFNCSEQYFMYKKCQLFNPQNYKLLELILTEKSPSLIKKYGRQVKNFDETIWNQHKYKIMLDGLRLKFSQNPSIKHILINTNTKKLYEASPYDKIWGIGYNAKNALSVDEKLYGENLLGKALMELRAEFI